MVERLAFFISGFSFILHVVVFHSIGNAALSVATGYYYLWAGAMPYLTMSQSVVERLIGLPWRIVAETLAYLSFMNPKLLGGMAPAESVSTKTIYPPSLVKPIYSPASFRELLP